MDPKYAPAIPTEDETLDRLRDFKDLENATAHMRHWEGERQRNLAKVAQANTEIAHADKCLATHIEKMNATLVKLGFLNAPDAEVGA